MNRNQQFNEKGRYTSPSCEMHALHMKQTMLQETSGLYGDPNTAGGAMEDNSNYTYEF